MPTARLIAITPNAEAMMAYVARVSSPNQDNPEHAKLLGYCMRHGHWSVFEHAFATVEVETTQAIARQLLRHSSFRFSEFSQRYAEVSADYVPVEARRQDTKNRQASHDDLPEKVRKEFALRQVQVWNAAAQAYRDALRAGVAKECARALLPEGMTPSRLYMTGSVRSWLHYLKVRLDPATQKEHRDVARAIASALLPELPTVFSAAEKYMFNGKEPTP